ncbi:MAG: protein TolA [Gammaproteobacteria bacterium HGW-Gammaproteobacteria-11]|nr:MAG: protein TolA [Gammaproteobacteria bacterium HGW-Gammaproteobacteria-11]
MNTREQPQVRSAGYAAPLLKALAVHLLVAILLFASFSIAPEFEPARPIVQATLVQLNSKSPATTPTDQNIAGEAARTSAPAHEAEELRQQQQRQQEAQEATARAEQQRQADAAAAAAAAARTEAQQREADAQKQAEAEAQRRADAARRLAAEEEAKKRAEEEAARRATEQARAREAEQRAAAARQAEADREARERREQEEARARALAELLSDEPQYQQAPADQIGDEVAASYDDLIRRLVSEQWRRPPSARNGMLVVLTISMLPTGQITDVVVKSSSGDAGFDQSAVQAVRNVGRIPEMQQLSQENPSTFDRMYRKRDLRFRPEDLEY